MSFTGSDPAFSRKVTFTCWRVFTTRSVMRR